MVNNRISVGGAEVARVVEWVGPMAPNGVLFPQTPESAWRDHADELVPTFWDPETGYCRLAVQTWVIRVDGLTVIVDTGVGNDRERPQNPAFHKLATEFPAALEQAGVDRDSVDIVINTHIHLDHVGWNTVLDNDTWRPTFPNARYLVSAADHDGSISAEHGVGRAKAPWIHLGRSAVDIDTMTRIRAALDPVKILNPHILPS